MVKDLDKFFSQVEACGNPELILLRSIELKLLKDKFINKLDKGRILDLGCGGGLVAEILFNKKIDYGLDNDRLVLKKARKRGIYKRVILADAREMPLKNGVCEGVFSNCVLEHIKELDVVLKEVNRVLKKNGLLVFTSLTDEFKKYSILGNWKTYTVFRDRKLDHYHGYSLKRWREKLLKHGFKIVDYYYYFSQTTTRWWDFLMLWSWWMNKVGIKLDFWIYRKFIYRKFLKAKAVGPEGAMIGILAKKI